MMVCFAIYSRWNEVENDAGSEWKLWGMNFMLCLFKKLTLTLFLDCVFTCTCHGAMCCSQGDLGRGLCSFLPSCGPRDWTQAILMALQFCFLGFLFLHSVFINICYLTVCKMCVGCTCHHRVCMEVRDSIVEWFSLTFMWVLGVKLRFSACWSGWQLGLRVIFQPSSQSFWKLSLVAVTSHGVGRVQKRCSAQVMSEHTVGNGFLLRLHLYIGSGDWTRGFRRMWQALPLEPSVEPSRSFFCYWLRGHW